MKSEDTRRLTACLIGLPLLLGSRASAQSPYPHEHDHPDVVIEDAGSRPRRGLWADSARVDRAGRVSTTPDNQILVELAPEDTTSAHLFDLNGRTLVFTPGGHGGYSRSVQSVAWVDDIGPEVSDGTEIPLPNFMFDFAGRRWGSFFVSRHGLITFDNPFTFEEYDPENRFNTMSEFAGKFVTTPTISPLYKPLLGGRHGGRGATQHVAHTPDRAVITWITTEPAFWVHGMPPAKPSRFQVVLRADGGIALNYADVALRDGIVGLFPDEEVTKGNLIASIADPTDSELPGHLDLRDVAIYESNTDALIVEWTMRDGIPSPPRGTNYSYRLYFDTDEPYFDDDDDFEFMWSVDVATDDSSTRGGTRLPTGAANRIALLVEDTAARGITASIKPDAAQFDEGRFVQGNWRSRSTRITLPDAPSTTDLSRSDGNSSRRQSEVFHYRGVPDTESIACHVISILGDEFDLFVFHNEFRVDAQETGTGWRHSNVSVEGVGDLRHRAAPCGGGRLKGHWSHAVWVKSNYVVNDNHDWRYRDERDRYDRALFLFAHEFTHAWTAYASYLRDGEREPLFGQYCRCHWREDLHAPAAFPWNDEFAGPQSVMGGQFWRDNGDGTFTPFDGVRAGGHSWLDLYMMGLASPDEVPDMFILRNVRPVNEGDRRGPHTGDKEIVSIEQVVAAEGARIPSARDAQKDFNAAFVYLLESGQTPEPEMLRLHAEYRDKVIEHWSHVTGGRSQMTTTVPGVANRSPMPIGTLADQVVPVDGTAVVDVRAAFRDPDGDPLTYGATSSAPAVASVEVSGSAVTVSAVSAGTATVTVTATDTRGSNATATLTFRVTVGGVPLTTFTDDPILPGVTPIKAVHFTELRERIDLLRGGAGLAPFAWTDPVLTAGVTPVRLSHLLELREAVAAAYSASRRAGPMFTDAAAMSGTMPIRAVHLMELRAAVVALE